jgi:hypothetical protein
MFHLVVCNVYNEKIAISAQLWREPRLPKCKMFQILSLTSKRFKTNLNQRVNQSTNQAKNAFASASNIHL